jgi:hypothetical protein
LLLVVLLQLLVLLVEAAPVLLLQLGRVPANRQHKLLLQEARSGASPSADDES